VCASPASSKLLSHWSHRVMLGAAPVWLVSTVFVWWSLGVHLDAADAFRGVPPWITRWDGPALLAALVAFATILVCAAVAIRSARRT